MGNFEWRMENGGWRMAREVKNGQAWSRVVKRGQGWERRIKNSQTQSNLVKHGQISVVSGYTSNKFS